MLVKLISPIGTKVKIGSKVYRIPGTYNINDTNEIPNTIRYKTNKKSNKVKIRTVTV